MVDMCSLNAEAIDERTTFAAQVRNLVWTETRRRMGINEQQGPATPNAIAPASEAAKQLHLVYLEVATEAGAAAQGLAAEAATRAGRAGATYADLGKSAGITRQAARKRWPDAAGTQWSLFLLTGKSHPHGLNVKVFRSRGRAIDAGRTAVDDGALSHDGAIAAVVVDSSRRTAWACSFNSGTWGPQEFTLPEKLQTVPATSDAGHSDWVQQWTQHVTRP